MPLHLPRHDKKSPARCGAGQGGEESQLSSLGQGYEPESIQPVITREIVSTITIQRVKLTDTVNTALFMGSAISPKRYNPDVDQSHKYCGKNIAEFHENVNKYQ